MTKNRLDILLVERGLAPSREKAKALIMAGVVFVNGEKVDKAGTTVSEEADIKVTGGEMPYVSRGGFKLQKAIEAHHLDLTGYVCADIGASTGGFSDCMLQHGAKRVYAIDVGYGQLAWKLRTDERVINLERTNIRYVTEEQIPELLDFGSIDVSFISLTLVLPVLYRFLREGGTGICLVKPQFEAGKGKVGKKGVVREPEIHLEVLQKIYTFCGELGLCIKGIHYSPIKGPEGNIEYLYYFQKSDESTVFTSKDLEELVKESHLALDRKDGDCEATD
ncbi:MAG: TlyA family RNA methyltransferase [Candidatus Merdivicinus sp.]|jgi:23S rRNA (cytidine1920-2'-O)/16S rRNA (cytidine1409-2'-O)-methyltransferase